MDISMEISIRIKKTRKRGRERILWVKMKAAQRRRKLRNETERALPSWSLLPPRVAASNDASPSSAESELRTG